MAFHNRRPKVQVIYYLPVLYHPDNKSPDKNKEKISARELTLVVGSYKAGP